jgi:hypothetical protein
MEIITSTTSQHVEIYHSVGLGATRDRQKTSRRFLGFASSRTRIQYCAEPQAVEHGKIEKKPYQF